MSRLTRLTTADFDRLVAEGAIREGSRAYLWDGEIIDPMPEYPPHVNANAVENLRDLMATRLPRADWTINQAHPVELSDGFKPQPDLSVLRGPRPGYRTRTPRPTDVALLVEVSATTYPEDSGAVLRRYAQEGIVQYWIVNLRGRRVEVYRDPDPAAEAYRDCRVFSMGAEVPLILTGDGEPRAYAGIDVAAILCDSPGEGT